ncbi:hypothetical protein CJ672_07970 [Arcobacter cryaerophilus gv. occultus]|uniref:hypothetical protein n=1 Tax=Aliarcobacter cryaerophilus TaxID=28198 RepID=UPI000D012356|nr:hypothetical protein [Aliarcobacter cryaerophilus]PRM91896.1 hypothetical protein CJ672_07970 [Arcobacter cryaerophilus gv. occultus]
MIKKILLISLLSSFLFAENVSLTGETIASLGNPYRVIFGEKNKTMKVYSDKKEIKLKVDSNYKGIDNKEFILENETIVNVLKQFYGEEYKVILDKDSNISLNVLSGEVSIDYTDLENNIQTLREVVVSLNIEIISNKGKLNKKVSLDHTLGDKQNGYSGMMTNEDISKLRIKTINQLIVEIIEREIFNELKEIK